MADHHTYPSTSPGCQLPLAVIHPAQKTVSENLCHHFLPSIFFYTKKHNYFEARNSAIAGKSCTLYQVTEGQYQLAAMEIPNYTTINFYYWSQTFHFFIYSLCSSAWGRSHCLHSRNHLQYNAKNDQQSALP